MNYRKLMLCLAALCFTAANAGFAAESAAEKKAAADKKAALDKAAADKKAADAAAAAKLAAPPAGTIKGVQPPGIAPAPGTIKGEIKSSTPTDQRGLPVQGSDKAIIVQQPGTQGSDKAIILQNQGAQKGTPPSGGAIKSGMPTDQKGLPAVQQGTIKSGYGTGGGEGKVKGGAQGSDKAIIVQQPGAPGSAQSATGGAGAGKGSDKAIILQNQGAQKSGSEKGIILQNQGAKGAEDAANKAIGQQGAK